MCGMSKPPVMEAQKCKHEISDPRFVCVWERGKRCLLQAGGGGPMRTERIYTQRGSIA